MSVTPDPTDAKADGNFGSAGGNHRAGYGDRLGNAEKWARKGGTLNAGEGAVLCEEIDRLRERLAALTLHMNQVHEELGGTDTVLTLEAAQYVMARLAAIDTLHKQWVVKFLSGYGRSRGAQQIIDALTEILHKKEDA